MKKKDDSGPIFNKLPPNESNLDKLLKRYINNDKLELLMSKYNIAILDKGNLGALLTLIIQLKEEIGECFIHTPDIISKEPYINKLYLSNQRKVCLSIPFAPISTVKDSKTNTSIFKFDSYKTNIDTQDRKSLYSLTLSEEIIKKYKTIEVEYNTDYSAGGAKGWTGQADPDIIVITNRYSMLTTLYGKPITNIYDYDNVPPEKVKEIYDFIMSTV
jgi:hypothetical protein